MQIYYMYWFQQPVFHIMYAVCVPMDFACTDHRFYASHFEGRVFPTTSSAAPDVKYDPWFTHANTLIRPTIRISIERRNLMYTS